MRKHRRVGNDDFQHVALKISVLQGREGSSSFVGGCEGSIRSKLKEILTDSEKTLKSDVLEPDSSLLLPGSPFRDGEVTGEAIVRSVYRR